MDELQKDQQKDKKNWEEHEKELEIHCGFLNLVPVTWVGGEKEEQRYDGKES